MVIDDNDDDDYISSQHTGIHTGPHMTMHTHTHHTNHTYDRTHTCICTAHIKIVCQGNYSRYFKLILIVILTTKTIVNKIFLYDVVH